MKRYLMGLVAVVSVLGAAAPALAHESEGRNFRDERGGRVENRFRDQDRDVRDRMLQAGREQEACGRRARDWEMRRPRERAFDGRQAQQHEDRDQRGRNDGEHFAARGWR